MILYIFWDTMYVAAATTSYGSSDHSSDPCHLMPWGCWSRCSFPVTWTGPLQLTVLRHIWPTDNRLQTVQNATARLLSGTRRYDHTLPVLHQLHWLPVRKQVDFHLRLPLAVQHGAIVPGHRLSARLWWGLMSAAFGQLQDICDQADLQPVRWQMLSCCRPQAVEQFSSLTQTGRHYLQTV